MIDIGANIGTYTLLAASIVGPTGRVDAFEPSPVPAQRLRDNVARNDLDFVFVHEVAVGDASGAVQFSSDRDGCCNHVIRSAVDGDPDPGRMSVQSTTLAECCDSQYSFAKVDVEGYEPLILKGASNMLAHRNPPVWQLELAGYSNRYGVTTSDLIGFLADSGYVCGVYNATESRLTITREPWKHGNGEGNVLAVAVDAFDLLRERVPGIRILQ